MGRRAGRSGWRRASDEHGAGIVEFAFVMPLLFLLVFGIIEFGWAFGQHLDVRHGAREGARLVAVDYGTSDEIGAEICERMDLASGQTVELSGGTDSPTGGKVGEVADVRVTAPLDQLTGLLDFAIGGITLKSHVQTRLEQQAEWTDKVVSC